MGGMAMGGGTSSGNVKERDFSGHPPGDCCGATSSNTSSGSAWCESPAKFVAPLPLPSIIDGTKGGSVLLAAGKACQAIFHNDDGSECGPRTEIWGFNGTWPGPTVQTQKGIPFDIVHVNHLGQDCENKDIRVSVHHHGLHLLPKFDGHPLPDGVTDPSFAIDPAGMIYNASSYTYKTTNQQEPGTFWYHDHTVHSSGRNVVMGLVGFFLLQPNNDTMYDNVQNLPSGDFEILLAIQDRSFTDHNQFDYPMNFDELQATGFSHVGYFGRYMLVNGAHAPYLNVKAGWYRFRLLNGCNARQLTLQIETSSGSRRDIMHQIGTEGGHISKRRQRSSIDMAPGERCDVLVDFRNIAVGTKLCLTNSFSQAPELPDVMEFRIVDGSTPNFTVPTELVSYSWPSNPSVERTIDLVPPMGDSAGWTIGGIRYDPDAANIHVQKGTTERWSFQVSHGGMGGGMGGGGMGDGMMMMDPHPMHVHLVQFHVDGLDSGSLQDGWKDIVMVPANGQVSITATFDGEPGVYSMHCHNLEHEDVDMMAQFEICDDSSGHPCDPTLLYSFTAGGPSWGRDQDIDPSSSAKEPASLRMVICLLTLASTFMAVGYV